MRRVITSSFTILLLGSAGNALAGGPNAFPSALPPVANPGECYAQVKIPAQYDTGIETVVKAEGYTTLEVTEPQFQTRREGVMVKEPSVRYEVRQPTYQTVTEQILTRPAHERLSVSPPQFSTVTENLQTSAPHLVWKRGNPGELQRQGYIIHSTADGRLRGGTYSGSYQGGSYATTQNGGDRCGPGCEIWCLVEEPGTSVATTRRVMSTPARVTRTPIPAEYKTIRKEVVTDPGGVREIPIEAEYASVELHDLVRPAETYEVNVPAEMGQVQTKVLVSPERYEWRRVLCKPGTGSIGGSAATTYQSQGSTGGYNYTSTVPSYDASTSYGHSYATETSPQPGYGTHGTNYGETVDYGQYDPGTDSNHDTSDSQPIYSRRGQHRRRR